MPLPIYTVDAFATAPFAGNPAAVVILDAPRPDAWMQALAAEMNLSETAFLLPEGDAYRLRWLTPAVEVNLCGHATLASAHVLWESGRLDPAAPARFQTRSGELRARRHAELIELDFPARPETPADPPAALLAALGAPARYVGRNQDDYIVELEDEAAVRALRPDHALLRGLPVRGVVVTARATAPGYDIVSRFFAPGSGIDEDPVTGSAHCCLAPYWAARLGKRSLAAYQASARGGALAIELVGERVLLRGRAITILRGELLV